MDIAEKVLRAKTDLDDVYEAGKKAEYDEFWDAYQDYGNRTDYVGGFSGVGWTDGFFKPKYNITISKADNMFNGARHITNIAELLRKAGVGFDTSNCTSFSNAFNSAIGITELPFLDLSKATGTYALAATFSYTNSLHTLHIKSSSETLFLSTTFAYTRGLVNLTIEGVIAKGTPDFRHSTMLSADSLKSIINALSTTTTGLTITLPTTAQSNYEKVYGSGSWATLTATRSNWTIAYA